MINFLEYIKEELSDLGNLNLSSEEFSKDNTALIIVDMVKGFYNEGPLKNPMVEEIINPMVNLLNKAKDYSKVFFIDNHKEDSVEFNSYPKHCVEGTTEAELIDEIKVFESDKATIIKKNSVNGFHCNDFKKWLANNSEIENLIIVGVCTDICVKNLAMSLVTYFNETNQNKKIIVPKSMIETYDAPFHNRDFTNLVSLHEMKSNGIKIVEEIK